MAKANVKKVPLIQVVVHRQVGNTDVTKSVHPPIGKTFEFTQDEVDEIEGMRKGSLRDPVNEDPAASREEVLATADTSVTPRPSKANTKTETANVKPDAKKDDDI